MTESFSCLGIFDSLRISSGFSRVAGNIVKNLLHHFDRFDVWGIGDSGWPDTDRCPWWPTDAKHTIYPATNDWTSPQKWQQLLNLILAKKYTHILIIQDPWNFSTGNIPESFEDACQQLGCKITFYVPVDCPMDAKWLKFLRICDNVVAYTNYGYGELRKAGYKGPMHIIPHGVDREIYRRLGIDRTRLRDELLGKVFKEPLDDKFVILCVSANQRRKGHWGMLETFKRLHDLDNRYRLVMHTGEGSAYEQIDLQRVAGQLGLPPHAWHWNKTTFAKGHHLLSEADLNCIYNAVDLVASTTLGEGWGLWITEALAAGTPVAVPDHSACKEIAETLEGMNKYDKGEVENNGMILLPLSTTGLVLCDDKSRVRYPVDSQEAANLIHHLRTNNPEAFEVVLNDQAKDWLDWKKIASAFAAIMLDKP